MKEENVGLLTTHKPKEATTGSEIVLGPYCFTPSLNPSAETPIKVRDHINNLLTLAQWNIRGINDNKRINLINSINCDLFALQEIGHPQRSFIELIHKDTLQRKERDPLEKGGGTLTLTNLRITHKEEFLVNVDTSLQRIILDGVFVIWFGNVYLNRGSTNQIQQLFAVLSKVIPTNEIKNLILIGDFNINIGEYKGPKFTLLRDLCKQFQLTINEPILATRGTSKLDFLITGSQINVKDEFQLKSPSDHNIVIWTIKIKATTKPKRIVIPNKALAKEITELAIMDDDVTNAMELIQSFLLKRKMKEKKIFLKLKQRRIQNDMLMNILLATKDEDSILEDLIKYWGEFWNDNEKMRYSALSKEAFKTMKSICKYHLFEKRDGSIVSQILLDSGIIANDDKVVSKKLIEVLENIQFSDKFEQYNGDLPFPELPKLEQKEIEQILASISTGKAVAFDLFSDLVLRDKEIRKKLTVILQDLWSANLNKIKYLEQLFKARLIALNKVHPKIPKETEFRPIIILSIIVKILESRWLPKLKDYLIHRMCPAQTGFVPGQGVFTNIFRSIKRIKMRTDNKNSAFALFIDFKSAYNYARHDLLFKRLEGILDPDEIKFQKAIYDKIIIRSGDAEFRPNLGVAQGSIISPALFDIYLEPLLLELKALISIEDILAYADDVLVICDNLEKLNQCIMLIEKWSTDNNLKINRNKSAIIEFIHRRKRTTQLTTGELFMNYPIVTEYKYLGTWLDQKLSLKAQIKHIQKKTYFIRSRLSPTLYNASLDFRKNLWQIFVLPMYEFLTPLYAHEASITNKAKINGMLRKSFKSYSGLKKTVKTTLIEKLMGYNIEERSKFLRHISEKKWELRAKNEIYILKNDNNINKPPRFRTQNLCKNLPKSMIKFINIQTCLCPHCQKKGINTRCSRKHLDNFHQVSIESTKNLIKKINEVINEKTEEKKAKSRCTKLEIAESYIMNEMQKIKSFFVQN